METSAVQTRWPTSDRVHPLLMGTCETLLNEYR